jgi:uncharacterized protein (TIGR03067 family)
MTFVTDGDGAKWMEAARFRIVVTTNTTPWQVNLSTKSKAGVLIQKKGICTLQNDTLKLSLGKPGKDRPTAFDDPTVATRVKIKK